MRYLLFHKPYGVVCQFSGEPPTLADFVNVPDVYAVGRLDKDSEGLLLLTDDGALQHRMTDPRFDHPKTYWAQVEGSPDDAALAALGRGVNIGDHVTRPAQARVLESQPDVAPRNPPIRYRALIPTTWIEITLTEGKNRQVRRMTAVAGFPTLRLIRIAIGDLRLDGLAAGEWRELTPREVAGLPRAPLRHRRTARR